jgi:hypothetical protein
MFAHTCSVCDCRQLVFPSQIESLQNTNHGIIVSFICWCGAEQSLLTGRFATEQRGRNNTAAA